MNTLPTPEEGRVKIKALFINDRDMSNPLVHKILAVARLTRSDGTTEKFKGDEVIAPWDCVTVDVWGRAMASLIDKIVNQEHTT